jgi:hypothetical protein
MAKWKIAAITARLEPADPCCQGSLRLSKRKDISPVTKTLHHDDCETHDELARALASAVNDLSRVSKSGALLEGKRAAAQHLRDARNAYWKHLADHGCGEPTQRLKSFNQKTSL